MYIPKKRFWLVMASVSLILIFSIVSGMSFSRYSVSQSVTGSNNKMADFTFSVTKISNSSNQTYELPLNKMKPGMSSDYYFTIKNFETDSSGKTILSSHLPFEYNISVNTYGNLPLNITVSPHSVPANTGVGATTKTASFDSSSPNKALSLTTTGEMFVNTTSSTQSYQHTYKLSISWPTSDTAKNSNYSTEVESVFITLSCSQLGPDY